MLVTGVASTLIAQVAVLSPDFAVMVALPTLIAFTTPFSTVATDGLDEVHVTLLSVASDGLTVAINVMDSPALNDALVLSKVIDSTSIGFTLTTHFANLFPHVAFTSAPPIFRAETNPSSTLTTESSDEDHTIVLFVVFSGRTVAEIFTEQPTANSTKVLSRATLEGKTS